MNLNTKITLIVVLSLITIISASAYVSVPTISDTYGFQYGNITIGTDIITAPEINAPTGRTANFIIAASDSSYLSKLQADFVCDGINDQIEIQAAINLLGPRGGIVHLTEGIFYISSAITIHGDGVTLEGSGDAIHTTHGTTQIYLIDNSDCNMIESNGKNPWVRDMVLDGNKDNQASGIGIYFNMASHPKVSHVAILYTKDTGVYLNSGSGAYFEYFFVEYTDSYSFIYKDHIHGYFYAASSVKVPGDLGDTQIFINGCERCRFTACHASLSNKEGWRLEGTNRSDFIACNAREATGRGWLIEDSHYNSWIGGIIYNINTAAGIRDGMYFQSNSSHNTVTNMKFYNSVGSMRYNIAEEMIGATDYNIYSNNIFGSFSNSAVRQIGINTITRNNIGHITENSGTATLVNGQTSIVVLHGLDITPSAGDIMVTPLEAWGSMTNFYIDTYTSTQFTIRADQNPGQDVDFAWKATVL